MPDGEELTTEDPTSEDGPKGLREANKRLETRAAEAEKELEALKARARSAELKSLMAENDVPLNSRTKFALTHYDGELDVDAVRTFLQEHGMIDPDTTPEELAEHDAAAQAAVGSTQTPDPSDAYEAKLAGAQTQEEVMALVREHQGRDMAGDLTFEDSSPIA